MLVRGALGEAVAIAHTIRAILGTVLADALAVKWAKELTKAYDRSALVGEHVAEARAVGSGGASLVGRITALEVGAARMRLCQRDLASMHSWMRARKRSSFCQMGRMA
jgi:hypothetical protein